MFACCSGCETTASETVDTLPGSPGQSAIQKAEIEERLEVEEERQQLPDTGAARKEKVTLKRATATAPWGLSFEQVAASDSLLITLVSAGAAEDFNKASGDGAYQFQKYDCIMGVNGQTSIVDMTKILSGSATQMELSIARPSTITETLQVTAGEALGIALKHTEIGKTTTVVGVATTGSVKKAEANVLEGDFIAAVNGEMGKGAELTNMMRNNGGKPLTLTLLRVRS